MDFVSYAQNFEDVMLWRIFKNVSNGFYIDIGAQDPVIDSVSLLFFEHGWHGVHVEPTKQYANKLRVARPGDVVEQVAVGKSGETLVFYEIRDTGLSTADKAVAISHAQHGFEVLESRVKVVALDEILEKYKAHTVHWLKIDVEGLECTVLSHWKFSKQRPWVLIIESTKPLTQEESYQDWEHLVVDKGYVFAYFDGLNRFYIHKSKLDLLEKFKTPPNIFDGFALSGTASQPFCTVINKRLDTAANLQVVVEQLEARLMEAEMRAVEGEASAAEASVRLQELLSSLSWRITRPLRFLRKICNKFSLDALKHKFSKASLQLMRKIIQIINLCPWVKRAILGVLSRFPVLELRLYRFLKGGQQRVLNSSYLTEMEGYSPWAQKIYCELRVLISNPKRSRY